MNPSSLIRIGFPEALARLLGSFIATGEAVLIVSTTADGRWAMPRDDRVANPSWRHGGMLPVQKGRFPIAFLRNCLLGQPAETPQDSWWLRLDAGLEP